MKMTDNIGNPKYVMKPWGHELILWNEEYCGKILVFEENQKSSIHYHLNKDEILFALEGDFRIDLYDGNTGIPEKLLIRMGYLVHVPTGMAHQIYSSAECKIIEVSTHHEDSDSKRIRA